jgi:hypothetical protein
MKNCNGSGLNFFKIVEESVKIVGIESCGSMKLLEVDG